MKRNPKPFSVEIKKSRVQGQRSHLPPRRLFELTPTKATTIFQEEVPQAVAEPSAAPRILPSILEPVWSISEPVEPVRRKRSSVEANRGQREFDLTATASEDVKDALTQAPETANAAKRTDVSLVAEENAAPVHDVQPAQGESVKANSRQPRKKASGAVEQIKASQPTVDPEQTSEAEMFWPLVVTPSEAVERRLTKRLAGTAQLPRSERWKRRLHPASW